MTYTLPTDYVSGDPPESAVANRLHGIVNVQAFAAAELLGSGVKTRKYGATSLQVTAGTGLTVNIAAGSGAIVGTSISSALDRSTALLGLAVAASSTVYIWAGLESTGSNKTEESGLPLLFASANASEPNATPLATVVTSGSAVTSVTDRRIFLDAFNIVTVTGAATIAATTDVQEVNTASANVQTLPATAPANSGGTITIKNLQAGAGITYAGAGSTTVEASAPTLTTAGAALTFYLSGTVWRVKAEG